MPLVSPFDEFFASVELSPEPLDPYCTLCSVSQVVSPCTLNANSHIMPVFVAHCLQGEQRLRSLDEHLCCTDLEFLRWNIGIFQDLFRSGLVIPSPSVFSGIRTLG